VTDHLLTIVTFLPLVGAVALIVWRGAPDNSARSLAMLTAVVTFVVSLTILGKFDRADSGYQLVEQATWVKNIGLQYLVGIDGVSLWMVLLTTFLFPLSVLASWPVKTNVRLYMASMLVLETAVLGSFVALDLLLFFVFFEALLVPTYLIIAGWGGERRAYAALKFFIFTMGGSAFMLAAIL